LTTSSGGASLQSGSIHVTPNVGTVTPVAQAILTFKANGTTSVLTGESAFTGTSLGMSVDGPSNTGTFIANMSATGSNVTYELTGLDGSPAGTVNQAIAGNGQLVTLLSDLFPSLPATFKGVLKVSSTASLSGVGVVLKSNLFSFIPMSTAANSVPVYIPHFAVGGGWAIQFNLQNAISGLATSGHLRFTKQDGTALSLGLY
jgi:hypothetical protein